MSSRLSVTLFAMLACLFLLSSEPVVAEESNTGPWDLEELAAPPTYEMGEADGLVREVYYEGMPYEGKPTRVFAYYARPEKVNGKLPAMVLVHGGGGQAFREWAELWAKRGYAALAMDLAGNGPDRKRLPDGGPNQSDKEKFDDLVKGVKSAWTYHAVSNVILGNSLLRSLEEVAPERIGITGISWGGYLTCITAGVDSRLKVAVPVYGCGFLHDNSVWLGHFARMAPELREQWIKNSDPSQYLSGCKMPVMFVNGTNDFAYPLDSYQKSYRLVKSPRTLCITVRMPHGHQAGWAPKEIGLFVDSVLTKGTPLPVIVESKRVDDVVTAKFESKLPVKSASLHFTRDTGKWPERKWETLPAELDGETVRAKLPANTGIVYFLTIQDERDAVVSSEHEDISTE